MNSIDISNCTMSLIGDTVLDALDIVGLLYKINSHKYHVSIYGTDNNADEENGVLHKDHLVVIEKQVYVDKYSGKNAPNQIKASNKQTYLEAAGVTNLQFNTDRDNISDVTTITDIYIDKDKYCWYKHIVAFHIKSTILETPETYSTRMLNTIGEMMIDALERGEK